MAEKTQTYEVTVQVTISGEETKHTAALENAAKAIHNRFHPVKLKVDDCEISFKVESK
jgi:uncharacterized pyridoxal phosphate-containing UPF0001 family protein